MDTPSHDVLAAGWTPEHTPDDHFVHLVGPLLTRMDGDIKRYAFVAAQKHMSRFHRLHGGMLLFLADKAMAVTAWELIGRPISSQAVTLIALSARNSSMPPCRRWKRLMCFCSARKA